MDDSRAADIQTLVEPILAEQGMELVELSCRPHGGQVHIRLLVDRSGGVTIQQCATANQRIGQALESANLFDGSYTLEVSSPGLDRPLATLRDFERALGEELQLDVATEDGRTRSLSGMLLAVQPAAVVLKTDTGNVTVPLIRIRTAKKVCRW